MPSTQDHFFSSKAPGLTLSSHKTHRTLGNGNEISLTFMVN